MLNRRVSLHIGRLLVGGGLVIGVVCANAAGGGSTGSGSMPSISSPQYDPAEEYDIGVAALEAGDFKEAERAFRKVVKAAPKNAESHYMLGLARIGRDNLRGARDAFRTALKRKPRMIQARAHLGATLARMGDKEGAQTELEVLLARQTDCAEKCRDVDTLAQAIEIIQTAMKTDAPQAFNSVRAFPLISGEVGDGAYLSAIALINEARYAEAIETLQDAELAFGPHPDVLTYLGFAHRKLRQYERAEAYYQAALAIAPEHRGATEYLGELRVEQGDVSAADRLLTRLESLCSFGCAEADELRRWIEAARS